MKGLKTHPKRTHTLTLGSPNRSIVTPTGPPPIPHLSWSPQWASSPVLAIGPSCHVPFSESLPVGLNTPQSRCSTPVCQTRPVCLIHKTAPSPRIPYTLPSPGRPPQQPQTRLQWGGASARAVTPHTTPKGSAHLLSKAAGPSAHNCMRVLEQLAGWSDLFSRNATLPSSTPPNTDLGASLCL